MVIKLMGEWAQTAGKNEIILSQRPHTLRDLLKMLEESYPCGKWEQSTIAVNHVLYNGDYNKTITDEDICIMPLIEGG